MIRRRESEGFWLITQHDHAQIAGALARHVGNPQFVRPDPQEPTLIGIASHDCGWPTHDDRPTLSPAKLPLDVFESPRSISHKAWMESARRATAMHPYAGLLVAIHALTLSAASISTNQPSRFDVQQMRQQFDINKLQHQAIELLEKLRGELGLHVDRPLRLGIGEGWTDAEEDKLKFNYRLLQAMDIVSLAICCTTPPESMTNPLHTRPGSPTVKLQLHRPTRDLLLVKPWPFDQSEIRVDVPYKLVPDRAYLSDDEFRVVYASAPSLKHTIAIRAE